MKLCFLPSPELLSGSEQLPANSRGSPQAWIPPRFLLQHMGEPWVTCHIPHVPLLLITAPQRQHERDGAVQQEGAGHVLKEFMVLSLASNKLH